MKSLLREYLRNVDIENFCELYSLHPKKITPLKKQLSCVYEVTCKSNVYIVKLYDSITRSKNEIYGEVKLVKEFIKQGVSTFDPICSKYNNFVEQIQLSKNHSTFGYIYKKIEGFEIEEDNNAYLFFTDDLLYKWGRLTGKIHKISSQFIQNGLMFNRPLWKETDAFNFMQYIPKNETKLINHFQETIDLIQSIPKTQNNFGLTHGDLHYGNFFINKYSLSVIDFDSSTYFYFVSDIAISLYSVLPYPRYREDERKNFAKKYLINFLKGYYSQFSLPKENLRYLPLFLKFEDMTNLVGLYRQWDMNNLTNTQKRIIKRNTYHLENNIPFVDIQKELDKIVKKEFSCKKMF